MDAASVAEGSSSAIPVPRDLTTHYAELVQRLCSVEVTRRSVVLGMAGAAVGLPLVGELVRASSRFSVEETDGALRLSVGGIPAWEIDERWFDGTPRLEVRRNSQALNVRLRRALFPGTNVPADLNLEARRIGAQWTARIRFDALGFCADVPLDTWLLGYRRADARVALENAQPRASHDLRFEHLHGRATFGPDWTLDLTDLSGAALRVGQRRTLISSLRLELSPSPDDNGLRLTQAWPRPVGGQRLEFASTLPHVSIDAADASLFLQASAAKLRLLVRQPSSNARLSWTAANHEPLTLAASDVLLDVAYARGVPTVSGSAAVAGGEWHFMPHFAVQFEGEVPGRLLIASNAPCVCEVPPPTVHARQFVVGVPACDYAMFRRRGTADDQGTVAYGDDILAFATHRIALDNYDLLLRRAADAFAVTLRFRCIDLEFQGSAWRLVPRLRNAVDKALVEYDFGSQHLLEEAVYLTEWCGGRVGCPDAAQLPVSDELAVDALMRACSDTSSQACKALAGASGLDQILATHPELQSPQRMIDWLHANEPDRFAHFKTSKELLAFLGVPASPSTPSTPRTSRAKRSHLLFDLGKFKSIDLSADVLLSWAIFGDAASAKGSTAYALFHPVLPARAAAAGTRHLDNELHSDEPEIIRPLSLCESAHDPSDYASGVEVPARLVMSQIERDGARWVRTATPDFSALDQVDSQRAEIWSVRLEGAKIRAVFTPDATSLRGPGSGNRIEVDVFHSPAPNAPSNNGEAAFRASLDARDRHEIVALTALYGYHALKGSAEVVDEAAASTLPAPVPTGADRCKTTYASDAGTFVPTPIDASLLQLTSLGANFRFQGLWDPPASAREGGGALSVTRYDHHGQIGRDILARVEYKGFLFPIGHPAILVKLTERRFCVEGTGRQRQSVARLVQRFFIRVPAFTRAFPTLGQPNDNRLWGHAAVSMEEFTTPDLQEPTTLSVLCKGVVLGQSAFVPKPACATGKDTYVLFEFADAVTRTRYSAPLAFVDNYVAHSCDELSCVITAWRGWIEALLKLSADAWPAAPEPGYAQVISGRAAYISGVANDNTDVETDQIILGVQAQGESGVIDLGPSTIVPMDSRMEAQRQPPFYPIRRRSRVTLTHLGVLSGGKVDPHLLDFDSVYATYGMAPDRNAGQVFGRFVDSGPLLDFGSDTSRSGGFASPSTTIVYLSAQRGPVGDSAGRLLPLGALPGGPRPLTASDESENAHDGNFDPRDFFSTFIGDARLLGVVRIADILAIALAASGTKIPTINRESLFDLAEDAIRPVMQAIGTAIQSALDLLGDANQVPPAVSNRLRPDVVALQQQWQSLNDSLNASNADPTAVVKAIQAFATAATKVASDADALVKAPQQLLPPDVSTAIDLLTTLWNALKQGDVRQVVQSVVLPPLRDAFAQVARDQVNAILAQVESSPEFDSLQTRLSDLLDRVATVSSTLVQAEEDVLTLLDRLYAAIAETTDEIKFLVNVTDSSVNDVVQELDRWRVDNNKFVDKAKRAATGGASDIDAVLTKAEADLSQLTGPTPEDMANAGRALASSRRAASALSDALGDLMSRLAALQDGAPPQPARPPRPANPKQASKPRLGQDLVDAKLRAEVALVDLVASLPKTFLTVVARATDVLDGLGAYAVAVNAAGLDKLCSQWATAIDSALTTFFQVLVASDGAPLPAAISHLRAIATRLNGIVPGANDVLNLYLPNLQKLQDALTPPVAGFGFAATCTAAKSDVTQVMAALLIKVPAPSDFDELEEFCSRLIQALAYRRQLNAAFAGLDDKVHALLSGFTQISARACSALTSAWANILGPVGDALRYIQSSTVATYFGVELSTALQNVQTALAPEQCAQDPRGWLKGVQTAAAALLALLPRLLSVQGIGSLVNVNRLLQDVVASLGVPTRLRVTYDWDTDVHEFPDGDSAVFEPLEERMLSIHAVAEAGLKGGPPTATLQATLSSFKINLFGKGASNFLSITFDPLTLTQAPGSALSCNTAVSEVVPGPALGFVSELQELFGGSSGFYVTPSFRGIEVGYQYSKDSEELGGFFVQNIAFSIAAVLPFDNSPVRFAMKLADKLKPFLISAEIYGGGGFFAIETRADTLELLEASFEFGAVAGFSFGVLEGSGRITAGIYIRLGGDAPILEGFFCAVGDVTIAGVIHVGASLRVSLTYEGSSMTGEADYEFHMSIGFVKLSYAVSVTYAKAGGGSNKPQRSEALTVDKTLAIATDPTSPRGETVDTADHPFAAEQWRRYWASAAESADVATV